MKLDPLRKKIDSVDEKIIKLIVDRFLIIEKIKFLKNNHHIPIRQNDREKEILKRIRLLSENYNLSEKFTLKIWKEILRESKEIQK